MSQAVLPGAGERAIEPELGAPAKAAPSSILRRPGVRAALGVSLLTALAVLLRLEGRSMAMWLDETLSVGIASHPLGDLPGLLRQDGSPPLYYGILHVWMGVFGDSAEAVRALSLVFGVATVPVAWWAGRSLFGPWVGWIAAILAATNPYMAAFSQEARMYTLMVLLALVAVTAFIHAFAFGRRRYLPLLVGALAALVYTHNWGLFLAAGLVAALVPCVLAAPDRRARLLDGGLAFGALGLLYLPWLPTALYQAEHTAAPWSGTPVAREMISAVGFVLGDERALVALVLGGGGPLLARALRWRARDGAAVIALGVALVGAVAASWASSQVNPAWAVRYFGLFLPPIILMAAVGLRRGGWHGAVALGLILVFWVQPLGRIAGIRPVPEPDGKTNVARMAAYLDPITGPGDLVVSAEIEQITALRYYFGPDMRYADPDGLVADPRVVDWRDATERLREASPATDLAPLVEDLPVGRNVIMSCPGYQTLDNTLIWFKLMVRHCRDWRTALNGDPRLERVVGPVPERRSDQKGSSVTISVYRKVTA